VLRLSLDTPAQMAMDYYCNTKEDTKSRGRAVVTLPVLLFNEYHYNFSLQVLQKIRMQIKETVDVQAKGSNGSTRA
jgi:hypothetical protein